MNKLITLILLLPSLQHAVAQCELLIPVEAVPLTAAGDTTVNDSEGFYWICEGVTVEFTGENNIILGEEGSFIHVFGDNNTVITKDGVMILWNEYQRVRSFG